MSQQFDAFNERRNEVLTTLRALGTQAHEVGAQSLARRIARDLTAKLEEDRFNLVVVGEFNHGKTTFVNALLGASVLPVGVTPTTAVIHHVEHALEPSAQLVPEEGEPQKLTLSELSGFVAGGGSDEDVRYIEVGYPAELLRDRIVLVDTPGVNDLCLQRADITYKYIPRSDAVLFVIDAGQPLKESERLFLKEKLIGQSRDKIIFVVTKADIWSEDERSEALGYVREELAKLVEGPVVFPVSAKMALSGELANSGMPELVAHLSAYLAEQRGRILLDNALGEGMEAVSSLFHGIDARRRTAKMSRAEIERRIARIELDLEGQQRTVQERRAAIREEAASIRAWVRRDLDRFCDDVIRQLAQIVESADVEQLRQHLPGFLEATFVEWAERESAEVARALEDLAERTVALMRDSAHEAAKRLSHEAGQDVAPPDLRVDTFGYDLGVAALFSVGLGMVFTNLMAGALMAGAAPVLAYYLKGRIELQTRDKAREQAAVALREAASKVAPKLDEMVTNFVERLEQWVEDASREVHQELLDVLHHARRQHETEEPNEQRVTEQCDALAERLQLLHQRVESQRAALWEGVGTGAADGTGSTAIGSAATDSTATESGATGDAAVVAEVASADAAAEVAGAVADVAAAAAEEIEAEAAAADGTAG